MTQRILNAEPSNPADIALEEQAPLDRVEPIPPGRIVLPLVPAATDQGTDGTCVAHAVGGVYAWWYRQRHGVFPKLDQRAFYTLVRRAVGAPPDPTYSLGLTLLWALRTAKGSGYPLANGTRGPRITGFAYVGSHFDEIQRAIVQLRVPAVYRIDYDAQWFYLPANKILKPPIGQIVGGHAMYDFGFDDNVKGTGLECGIDRNSWGPEWATVYFPDAYKDAAGLEGWIITGIA